MKTYRDSPVSAVSISAVPDLVRLSDTYRIVKNYNKSDQNCAINASSSNFDFYLLQY